VTPPADESSQPNTSSPAEYPSQGPAPSAFVPQHTHPVPPVEEPRPSTRRKEPVENSTPLPGHSKQLPPKAQPKSTMN